MHSKALNPVASSETSAVEAGPRGWPAMPVGNLTVISKSESPHLGESEKPCSETLSFELQGRFWTRLSIL